MAAKCQVGLLNDGEQPWHFVYLMSQGTEVVLTGVSLYSVWGQYDGTCESYLLGVPGRPRMLVVLEGHRVCAVDKQWL